MFCFRGGMGAGSLDCAMWLCLGKGFGGMERRVGDPELGAPLVVAGDVVDDLNAVVCYVGFESGGGCPDESAAVGGGVDDAADYEGFDVSVEPSNQRIGKNHLLGRILVDGPRKRTMEIGPGLVGCQVMLKGVPAGTG